MTPQEIVDSIGQIVKDVSIFTPPPISTVAALLGDSAQLISIVLNAKQGGVTNDLLVSAIEQALKAASDADMAVRLKP